ncbi:hypothetical protein Nepgr_003353 [Nepenthes gracilis]|uniref:Uncharacterized protein n=1 Tax=Nepenthes gracilis TaxID=150966 RepID=A0AAD3XDF3_NEPGR|nr:hypothetical protein Nepgr_003353 [Nepenthes gracilis]
MEREKAITISLQTPLLQTTQNRQQPQQGQQQQQFNGIDEDDHHDTHLDKTLQRLDFFLCFLGFHQTSIISFGLSWAALLLVGIAIPVVILELSSCSGCEEYQVRNFEFIVLASQASLGAVSLLCLSHNLRKYGIRKFLFVDRFSGQMVRFMDQYIQKIRDTYRMLMLWLLPCLVLKTARETIRLLNVKDEPWWQSAAIALALIISWMYMNAICLVACIMFHLVCSLQVIHFDDYGKLLERESNIFFLMQEHFRLRQYLSKISHRFRIYLLLVFLVVTASQFVTLLETTGYSGTITFLNGGDFAVTSIVQVVGITLCLHAATKISHRAQGIASVASKWHALATCNSPYSGGAQSRRTNSSGSLDTTNHYHSLSTNYSESDLESLDWTSLPSNMQLPSFASSYHKRQSFVMYLQTNPGGITIFGWTVDRALICTIFFIELSLVLFVLGNTVTIPSGAIPPS